MPLSLLLLLLPGRGGDEAGEAQDGSGQEEEEFGSTHCLACLICLGWLDVEEGIYFAVCVIIPKVERV